MTDGAASSIRGMAPRSQTGIVLRAMSPADCSQAFALSRSLGWPHREEDWAFYLTIGEGIVAAVDGRVMGTVMAFRHSVGFATLGMVIVDKALQGKGVGRRLVEAMMAQLSGCSILLQATEEGVPLYTKLGFIRTGVLHQHQGLAPAVPEADLLPDERICALSPTDKDPAELYAQASGTDRTALMKALLSQEGGVMLTRSNTPAGFAMLRVFGHGNCIGPVVANDSRTAKILIRHWLGKCSGAYTRIDIVGGSGLSEWLSEIGLPRNDTAQTMTHGAWPSVATTTFALFAVTAHALG